MVFHFVMYGRAIELVSAVRFKARVFVVSEKFSKPTNTCHNHSVALKCSNFSHVNKTTYKDWIRTYVAISTEIVSLTRFSIRLPIKQIKCIAFAIWFENTDSFRQVNQLNRTKHIRTNTHDVSTGNYIY